uniref:Uncharacterized protein n=1 Tax=uncultured marine virus TaxID=186617 RepID=A0A0F7L913_9VIRU|nr:hypothetical protein [uncultured marine virus]
MRPHSPAQTLTTGREGRPRIAGSSSRSHCWRYFRIRSGSAPHQTPRPRGSRSCSPKSEMSPARRRRPGFASDP